jgi:hypothetical protein
LKKISTAGGNNSQSVSSSSSSAAPSGSSGDAFVSLRSILEDVCCRLSPIWSGLVYEGSVISKHALGPLCLISRIGVVLSELLPSLDSAVTAESAKVVVETIKYDNFLVSLYSGFPYVLFESTVAMPGSKEEMEAKHLAGMLNIAVSEATLLWCKQSQVSKLMQTAVVEKSSFKISKDATKNSAHTILETVHLQSTMAYVHTSLTFLNDSLSNKALSPTALMTDDWDDHLQRLFHCISLEVLFLSEKSSSVSDHQRAVSSGDEEAIGHVLNDLCMLIRFSVEMLSSLSFSHANVSLINRLTFILKSTVTCASHITASENLLWETTNSSTISKITLLTQTLSLLPKSMVGICQKSAAPNSSDGALDASLSDSEYVVYIALSTLLLLLRRCSTCSDEDSAASDEEGGDEGGDVRMQTTSSSPSPSATMWNTIIVQVSAQVAALFAESDGVDDAGDRGDAIFVNYSFPIRMLLLDIWYYCRFDHFEEVAEDSIVSVTGMSTGTSVEQEKMLYLLFLRRSEMGVTAFVSSLMRGFETCVVAIYEKFIEDNSDIIHESGEGGDGRDDSGMEIENSASGAVTMTRASPEEDQDEESLLLEVAELIGGSDWCVYKIATTLYQCGSSSSPHLIAKYTLLALQDMIADEQYEETDLYCYSVGIFSILQTLLAPFRRDSELHGILNPSNVETLNSLPPNTDVDSVEGIILRATELMADFMIRLLLCHAGTTDATSKLLRLGFRQLREGEPLANSLLFPVMDGLVTRWDNECLLAGEEGEEESKGVYSFDVFFIVLDKIESNLSEYRAEETISLLDFLFEIVQYWKLSEDDCFEIYKGVFLEKLNQWVKDKTVTEHEKVTECVDDIISFINSN